MLQKTIKEEYSNQNKVMQHANKTNARTSGETEEEYLVPWYESVRRSVSRAPQNKQNDFRNNYPSEAYNKQQKQSEKFQGQGQGQGQGYERRNMNNTNNRNETRFSNHYKNNEGESKSSVRKSVVRSDNTDQNFQKKGVGTDNHNRDQKQIDFWNQKLLDYIIENIDAHDQKPFKAFNQNAEQIVIDDMGFSVQSRKTLPNYLEKLGVISSFIENSLIYQVDTIYSLWHSILALIYPDYLFLDYERKRLSVMRFRDTVNNEFINNQRLRNEIQMRKLRLVHVENAISQEKIQDEVLLRFFAIFFDINIYLVDEDSCYVYHNLQNFTGKPICGLTTNASCDLTTSKNLEESQSKTIVEFYNPYKSSILLFRFPYGNIAPVFQEGRSSQILTSSTDPGFILPISKKFLGTEELPEKVPDSSDNKKDSQINLNLETNEQAKANDASKDQSKVQRDQVKEQGMADIVKDKKEHDKNVKEETEEQALRPKLIPRKKEQELTKEEAKERFMGTMLKLKWEELSSLAEKETINPMQPTTKGFNSWKKKTKNQLAEELWEATQP